MLTTVPLIWVIIFCVIGATITLRAALYYRTWLETRNLGIERNRYRRSYFLHISFFAIFSLTLLWSTLSLFADQPLVPTIQFERRRETNQEDVPGTQGTLLVPDPLGAGDPQLALSPAQTVPLTPSPTPPTLAIVGNTGGVGVNLRNNPGLGTEVVTVLAEGEQVIVLGELRTVDGFDWQQVRLSDGRDGWIANTFLDIIGDGP